MKYILFGHIQEMLFRRTCKLVELEAAKRNAEKAKPVKKAAVSTYCNLLCGQQVSVTLC